MIRNSFLIIILAYYFCLSCESDIQFTDFEGKHQKYDAYASIRLEKNIFYGTYTIQYPDEKKDVGTIRGERLGDTLLGKYKYKSRNGDEKIVPIAFLYKNDTLTRGKGIEKVYAQIPFYDPQTLIFADSLGKMIRVLIK